MKEIMTFRGEYQFLSNMYPASFVWDGRPYRNSEAAFQSAKSLDPAVRDRFSEMTGVAAKREGKKVLLRADWERVKDGVMEEVVREKFLQNPDLLRKLIDTGDRELTDGNRWHDRYWGVDLMSGEGENRLGIILMKLRAELGGQDYLEKIRKLREEKEAAEREAEETLSSEIQSVRERLDALPHDDFTGRTVATKAFGSVTIDRQEGDYLFFEVNGIEKKFQLPGCVLQGFLIPEDPAVIERCRRLQALRDELRALEKKTTK